MPRKKKPNHTHTYLKAVAIGAFTLLAVTFVASAAGVTRNSRLAFILVPWDAPCLADASDGGWFCGGVNTLTDSLRATLGSR